MPFTFRCGCDSCWEFRRAASPGDALAPHPKESRCIPYALATGRVFTFEVAAVLAPEVKRR